MSVQFTLYSLPYYLSSVCSVIVAAYAVQQGRKHGFDRTVRSFVAMQVMALFWVFCVALDFSVTDRWLKLAISAIRYSGAFVPVFFLLFALAFVGRDRFFSPRYVVALSIVPAVGTVLAVTNWYHGLMWSVQPLVEHNGAMFLQREFTSLFNVTVLYGTVLGLLGSGVLLKQALTSQQLYRRQAIAVASGTLVAVGITVVWLAVGSPVEFNIPSTPLAFSISGVLYGYAIFRFRFLDIAPVARDTVIDNMRDGYLVVDPSGRIVDINDAGQELLDRTDGDVIGDELATLLPSEDEMLDERTNEARIERELAVETACGDQRFLVAHCSDLTKPDRDRPLGQLVILRDITNRRRVQKRYQALIEHSSDLTVVLDEEGTIIYASPSAKSITGVSAETIIGRKTLDLVHPDDAETLTERFEEILADPDQNVRFEYRLRHIDGSWHTMEGVARNLLGNPYVEGIVVNARDITARKERERELRRTNEQLEQFANIVSHDLRNPLTVAQGHLRLYQETGDTESLETIEQSHERMETIIEDVLTLAQQGKSIGETEHVDLASAARDAWEHVQTNDADLIVDSSVTITADRDRLLQLLENCFRNAVEHAGTDVTVTVGVDDQSFFVADDGPGIPEENRDDALEPGYTTGEMGTGFGLSIVSQIAEAHGWIVEIETSSTGGAQFTFRGETFDDLFKSVSEGQKSR
ncbi:histidine kinase N-terminal 7TM domain-containing protein [Natrinema halophilum]|uniref:histidine kinase n=1 Tax=Natrinema halophilum TaxID=1699371 RepID=A0A7D5H0I0_9EURY|nr:histidine kinase N-terminal 7TM domain-containing protein [Natrinema halophilum]QLG47531.1 PAS domain S-box protein [Natrinema halophilum]